MPVPGLQSTLARRLHVLVLLVAPIPLGLMAWTAIGQYQRQLTAETEHRLAERAKEAGLDVVLTDLLYVYSDPRRDPRSHTVSAVFLDRASGEPAGADDEVVLFRVRHRESARRAVADLSRAESALGNGAPLELVASDLAAAASALGGITGEMTSEDVLDRVFADFCIGK